VQQRGGATKSGKRRFKAETIRVAMDHETRNGTGNDDNEEYTNIYFIVGDRRETATYRANQVTDMELKGERVNFYRGNSPIARNFFICLTRLPSCEMLGERLRAKRSKPSRCLVSVNSEHGAR